eukprot:scaffold14164_cov33-Phaeocystis_antarctica.AAC.1
MLLKLVPHKGNAAEARAPQGATLATLAATRTTRITLTTLTTLTILTTTPNHTYYTQVFERFVLSAILLNSAAMASEPANLEKGSIFYQVLFIALNLIVTLTLTTDPNPDPNPYHYPYP